MPFRTWMYVFAIIGLTGPALGQPEEAQEDQGRATGEQKPASEFQLPIPVEVVEYQEAADARESREKESQQREIEDLIAQQGMNDATQAIKDATLDMRDYALYSTILVGAGTALLVVTLLLTWAANKAAIRAAAVSLRSERAWLKVNVEPAGDLHVGQHSVLLKFLVKMVNIGKSPATVGNVFYRIETRPEPTKLPDFVSYDFDATAFPGENLDDLLLGFDFAYPQGFGATLVLCVHYVDLLTDEKHWVERRVDLFAGKRGGPFKFEREINLSVDDWGFYEDGKYRVDNN